MPAEISLDHLDRQLKLVLEEVRALRQLIASQPPERRPAPSPPPKKAVPPPPAAPKRELQRFVTIEHFMKMVGYKSRVSYYNHLDDEGWPQRVYPYSDSGDSGKALLRYEDCVAYQEMVAKRVGPSKPFKKRRLPPLPDGRKRHSGRPVKPHPRA